MDLSTQYLMVVGVGFALAFVYGAVAQASNFCTMGAVADVANFGDWTRARLVLTSVATAIVGTSILIFAFGLDANKSIYASKKFLWLSHIVGGLLFGFGMTIASGCGSKTLLRAGAGSLKAVVTLLIMAIASYMTLRGLFALFRVNILEKASFDLPTSQLLPSLFGLTGTGALSLALALATAVFAFIFSSRDFRQNHKLALAGIVMGLMLVGGWSITGLFGFLKEHPETLESAYIATNSARPESFSFVAPVAYGLELLFFWTDKSTVLTFGIASVLGMLGGSAAYALATKSFRWEGFANTEDLANHLVGGALMGFGGVVAMGCTVGQGGSGLSVLSLGALLTVLAIVIGSRLALRYQEWRIEKMDV
jgi:uncharacterized protein